MYLHLNWNKFNSAITHQNKDFSVNHSVQTPFLNCFICFINYNYILILYFWQFVCYTNFKFHPKTSPGRNQMKLLVNFKNGTKRGGHRSVPQGCPPERTAGRSVQKFHSPWGGSARAVNRGCHQLSKKKVFPANKTTILLIVGLTVCVCVWWLHSMEMMSLQYFGIIYATGSSGGHHAPGTRGWFWYAHGGVIKMENLCASGPCVGWMQWFSTNGKIFIFSCFFLICRTKIFFYKN